MRKQYHDRYAGLVPDRDIEEILRTHWADPTLLQPPGEVVRDVIRTWKVDFEG